MEADRGYQKANDSSKQDRHEAVRRQGQEGQVQGHPVLQACPRPGRETPCQIRAQQVAERRAVTLIRGVPADHWVVDHTRTSRCDIPSSRLGWRFLYELAMPTRKRRAAQGVRSPDKRQTPTFVTPMAALLVDVLPEGSEWSYELKLDGYRALIIKDGASIRIRSRNDKDLMQMYPAVAAAGRRLQADQAVIDGEIVAVDEQGRPSFQALQHRGTHPRHTIVFYAFDLLHLNGEDTTALPLKARRAKLVQVIEESGLLLSLELPGSVADIVSTVRAMQLEGVVAKRKDSPYEAGERSGTWQKLKLERQ